MSKKDPDDNGSWLDYSYHELESKKSLEGRLRWLTVPTKDNLAANNIWAKSDLVELGPVKAIKLLGLESYRDLHSNVFSDEWPDPIQLDKAIRWDNSFSAHFDGIRASKRTIVSGALLDKGIENMDQLIIMQRPTMESIVVILRESLEDDAKLIVEKLQTAASNYKRERNNLQHLLDLVSQDS